MLLIFIIFKELNLIIFINRGLVKLNLKFNTKYYFFLQKKYQLFIFNYYNWKLIVKNNDVWLQLIFNKISVKILKYTPDLIIKYYRKMQAYKKAHPWKYRGIRFSIFTSMKLAGGGLLVTLIVWPPFLYKIGKGTYYVSQMSVSDMWYGIENIGWKKVALLGTLVGTGLMGWYFLDNILYKPIGKETWVENNNPKWVKNIEYEKRFKFLDNFSKIFTKFQIFLENTFIDRRLLAGINRLEEQVPLMELKKKRFVKAYNDWIDCSNKGQSESALNNAELKVNARYNELTGVRKLYLSEAEVILKKKFMDNVAEPNITFSELVKIRILNISREMNLKEELAANLVVAEKEGWSKLAIVELKKTYIEELCSVYNSNANVQKTQLEIKEWKSNVPRLKEIAQKRINEVWHKEPLFIETNKLLEQARIDDELIAKFENECDDALKVEDAKHDFFIYKAKMQGAPDDWISSKNKQYEIKREKVLARYNVKIDAMYKAHYQKHGTREDIILKVNAKFRAEELIREKTGVKKVMLEYNKKKLFTHYNGLPDEKSESLFKQREVINDDLKKKFKKEADIKNKYFFKRDGDKLYNYLWRKSGGGKLPSY